MQIQSIVDNELTQDSSSVWVLKDHGNFGYSEGEQSERYLDGVLRKATDLSSRSSELQSHIKDWSSEYHLTPRRSQLLSGFRFDRSLKVLEVGCGCGAITRYLGESFDQVVSVEGSIERARLAGLRTRDLPGVNILCAPFQQIRFLQKFDVIFCIGVYEYSASFVDGADPYDNVLRYFNDMLTPDGVVILAIENQFGLKYFSSSREDHLGVMFEGLEGYHADHARVRTFGRSELRANLQRYFPSVTFYYPYPDYKVPDSVLTDEFLASGHAGELVSQMKARDYAGDLQPLWDEAAAALELSRNGALQFFANSFLVVAAKGESKGVQFDQLGVFFSPPHRRPEFATRSRIVRGADGRIVVSKTSLHRSGDSTWGCLRHVDTDSSWVDSHSLQTEVYLRCKSRALRLEAIFEPCRKWVALLDDLAAVRDGAKYLGGGHIDSIWSNVHPGPGGYAIVDREWVWEQPVRLNAIVIRAIYNFLVKIDGRRGLSDTLDVSSGRRLISRIAAAVGVKLNDSDFEAFVDLESQLQSAVFGLEQRRHRAFLRWFLLDRSSLKAFRTTRERSARTLARVRSIVSRSVGG